MAEAQLKWTIFQFGKQLAKYEQSQLKTEIAKLETERAYQTVCYDVAQAYFRVLEAKSALEIAERSVEQAEAYSKESGDLLRRGVITREENLRAEASLAGFRQERFDAKSAEEVAVAALNRAMGININAPTHVAERARLPVRADAGADPESGRGQPPRVPGRRPRGLGRARRCGYRPRRLLAERLDSGRLLERQPGPEFRTPTSGLAGSF